MKLRIKDNSIRFRLLRDEVKSLREVGRIEACTWFSATNQADRLVYIIEHGQQYLSVGVAHIGSEIRVTAPTREIVEWATGDAIGVYGEQPVYGAQTLKISIEKDLACLDRSHAENLDTFENPNALAC